MGATEAVGEGEGVVEVMRELVVDVINACRDGDKHSRMERAQVAVQSKGPRLKKAVRLTATDVVHWMHDGGAWRAFLVTAVGIISLIALTGLTAFTVFLIVATINAVVVGLLMSMSAVGAFMAFFFTSLTFIFIGAVTVTACAVGVITFMSICAVLFTAGWIAFAWVVWQGIRKVYHFVRGSIAMTGSALSTVSAAGNSQIISFEKPHKY